MGQVGLKTGARPWSVRRAETGKVVVTKEKRNTDPKKKTTKKEKRSDTEKNHGLRRRPRGLPFPLDHRHVPIRAFHANFDHRSIHIGSSSSIQQGKVTKKRVLQRVLPW
jgi:hypothetical protein